MSAHCTATRGLCEKYRIYKLRRPAVYDIQGWEKNVFFFFKTHPTGFYGFYWVLLGFIGSYWVLLDFIGFY